jgi:hypothetical protein
LISFGELVRKGLGNGWVHRFRFFLNAKGPEHKSCSGHDMIGVGDT